MTITVMHLPAFSQEPPRPKKCISAGVLLDGFAPAPPRDTFNLDHRLSLVARYLSEPGRGFSRLPPMAQFPKPAFITLHSPPSDIDQYRLAFGMTLLEDVASLGGRMSLRLRFGNGYAGRFINAADPSSCIRFLEVIEGVDSMSVRYRYSDKAAGAVVRGELSF